MSETERENNLLPVDYAEPANEELAVTLDDAARRRLEAREKRKAKIAEAAAHEALGQRLLKFKAKKFGELGDYIVGQLGVKKVGHGTIIAASQDADQYIRKCDALVEELMSRNPPVDPVAIIETMRLAKEFIQLLLDSGEAHLRIDRSPSTAPPAGNLTVPFPPSMPMTVTIAPTQQPPPPRELPSAMPPVEGPDLET